MEDKQSISRGIWAVEREEVKKRFAIGKLKFAFESIERLDLSFGLQ